MSESKKKSSCSFIKSPKLIFIGLILLLVGGAGGAMLIIGTVIAVEKTSGVEFCSSCHSMTPMVKSYKISVHGGNNTQGLTAKCSDCHLPHDNIFNYMRQKIASGNHDLVMELFADISKIDWNEKRKHREKYVYDSGCMKCHKNLEGNHGGNHKAFIAHKDYFMGTSGKKCVSCHEHVGHKNLGLYLKK